MNISLAKASNQAKKSRLSMGLNARGGGETGHRSVFLAGDDDEGDDPLEEEDAVLTGRAAVNRAIAQEQAALRARAAAANSLPEDIYDYDKAYDSFHPSAQDAVRSSEANDAPRQSRYIQDLLQTAAQRQMERDIAQERKMARELSAEEAEDPELRHKERFVTASYRRKLEERKLWQERQAQRDEQDEALPPADGGMAMAKFYGNLTQKKPMEENRGDSRTEDSGKDALPPSMEEATSTEKVHDPSHAESVADKSVADKTEDDPVERRRRQRQLREEKVQQARLRYFQRHGRVDTDSSVLAHS